MASLNVGNLGDYLREQRRNAQLSLRQLADAAGVSNPYLSQIERGLRKPSAEVLQQVAKALRISAETLYVRAGILDAERDRDEVETRAVILADPTLHERQKQVLLQIYESFRKENGFGIGDGAEGAPGSDGSAVLGVVVGGGPADGDAPDGGTGIPAAGTADGDRPARRRAREQDGGASARTTDGGSTARRRPRKTDGGTSAVRRTRKGTGGNDTDPQQTAG
ncbi:helix-turn-helix domain-containing protein [Streptomyces sp. NPDC002788]